MSYTKKEQSLIRGEPVELYRFKRGGEYWTYNSSDIAITYAAKIYEPELIRRGDIELTSNSLKNLLKIEVDRANKFAVAFLYTPVEHITELVIYRGHRALESDGTFDFVEYWKGCVHVVRFLPKTVNIIASPKTNSLKRSGLMRKFQRTCGYQIYTTRCTLLKSNYIRLGTIISIDGTKIEATIFGTEIDGWFVGGLFEADSQTRMITWHEGNFIRLTHKIMSLEAGMSLDACAGCPHSASACHNKFNNKINYGGQEFIPNKNPFVGDSVDVYSNDVISAILHKIIG